MFPDLRDEAVLAAHVWRAQYAQPVVERGYRRLLPDTRTPVTNLFLATMAQIYPQDRGTNYAIRQGREVARAAAAAWDGAQRQRGAARRARSCKYSPVSSTDTLVID